MGIVDESAIKTYRYLRLGMVVLVVVLGASVLIERWKSTDSCWLTSISAYYYTPVQAIFVGALIAIGVALITVKGSTNFEDTVLNLGGMLAPIVALVPTGMPDTSQPGDVCWSVTPLQRDPSPLIDNNFRALAIGAALSLLLVVVIANRKGIASVRAVRNMDREPKYGLAVATVLVVAMVIWYVCSPSFETKAHSTAAITMFVFIGLAVLSNARATRTKHHTALPYRTIYWVITIGMVAGALLIVIMNLLLEWWDHEVLWLEIVEIGLFGAFWAVQTIEFWNDGVRLTEAE